MKTVEDFKTYLGSNRFLTGKGLVYHDGDCDIIDHKPRDGLLSECIVVHFLHTPSNAPALPEWYGMFMPRWVTAHGTQDRIAHVISARQQTSGPMCIRSGFWSSNAFEMPKSLSSAPVYSWGVWPTISFHDEIDAITYRLWAGL